MLSRKIKSIFYAGAGPLMSINASIYRWLRAPRSGKIKLHLGPGQQRYIDGWINIDANKFTGKCDVWADLRNPLPFHDQTVTAVYSHHVVEHLPDLDSHFADVFRTLKPGGVYRVGGPNGDVGIERFIAGDKDWFPDYPCERKSIGGKFENFVFCKQEHLTILTYSYLMELMKDAGFVNIRKYLPVKETGHQEIFDPCMKKEHEKNYDFPRTLILEGERPF